MDVTQESYYRSNGDVPLLEKTISQHFHDIATQFPDHEAVVSVHQDRRLSYQQLKTETDHLARGLLAIGFKRGDRVGIWATNNIEWLLLQIATARIGVVLVNINPAYRSEELAYSLQRSEVHGVFCMPQFRSSDYVAMLVELIPELQTNNPDEIASHDFPFLRRVVVYDPQHPETTEKPHTGFMVWQEVLQAAEQVTELQLESVTGALDPADAINIQYTSGTTGFPKAVVLTHRNILNNACTVLSLFWHGGLKPAVSLGRRLYRIAL
jgi:fatty-acyl-CoA synthase